MKVLIAVTTAVVGISCLTSGCSRPSAGSDREEWAKRTHDLNILLVTLDTTRADRLGCYGYDEVETPHLDRLAKEGVRYARAFAQVPLTLPSHTSIFTGTLPPFHGVRDNGSFRAPGELVTLAELLADQGYETGAFVGAFVLDARFGLDQGFQVYDDDLEGSPHTQNELDRERLGARVVDRAVAWLGKRPPSGRFFLWVHLFDPHVPYKPPPPYDRPYALRPYDGEIAYTDANIGRLLTTLDTQGVGKRTLVVVVGDHGESLGEHGESGHSVFVYDPNVRVPLLFWWPNGLPQGVVVERQVRTIDVMPTLLEILGIDLPSAVQGESLLDLCFAPKSGPDRPAYSESYYAHYHFGGAPLRALRTAEWKYIDAPKPELYALGEDPGEKRNRIQKEPEIARRLAVQLEQQIESTGGAPLEPETVVLDAAERDALLALGYVSGRSTPSSATGGRDPKELIGAIRAYNDAQDLSRKGRFREAAAAFEALEEELPDSAWLHFHLGAALTQLRAWSRAEASLQRALAIDSTYVQAMINLGGVYREQGRAKQARRILEQALVVDPEQGYAHLNLALLDEQAGHPAGARVHFQRFLELAPGDPNASAVRQRLQALPPNGVPGG